MVFRSICGFFFVLVIAMTAGVTNTNAADAGRCPGRGSPCNSDPRLEMAGIADPERVRAFLGTLKQAINADDRQKIASVIKYPLRLYNRGKVVKTYQNEAAVVADFDSLFTASVRSAILAAHYDDLFINAQGVMIGNGAVWLDGWGTDNKPGGPIMIKSINPHTG